MNKVYIVHGGNFYGGMVFGVFESFEDADAHVNTLAKMVRKDNILEGRQFFTINGVDLNKPLDYESGVLVYAE